MNSPLLYFFLVHQNKLKTPKQTKKSQAQQEQQNKLKSAKQK